MRHSLAVAWGGSACCVISCWQIVRVAVSGRTWACAGGGWGEEERGLAGGSIESNWFCALLAGLIKTGKGDIGVVIRVFVEGGRWGAEVVLFGIGHILLHCCAVDGSMH